VDQNQILAKIADRVSKTQQTELRLWIQRSEVRILPSAPRFTLILSFPPLARLVKASRVEPSLTSYLAMIYHFS
jgi:hypothetical protein